MKNGPGIVETLPSVCRLDHTRANKMILRCSALVTYMRVEDYSYGIPNKR